MSEYEDFQLDEEEEPELVRPPDQSFADQLIGRVPYDDEMERAMALSLQDIIQINRQQEEIDRQQREWLQQQEEEEENAVRQIIEAQQREIKENQDMAQSLLADLKRLGRWDTEIQQVGQLLETAFSTNSWSLDTQHILHVVKSIRLTNPQCLSWLEQRIASV